MESDQKADSLESSFREMMIEHTFVSEIMQEAWFRRDKTIEVLRSEVDSSGYDLVLEFDGVVRYVQLKGSRSGASTASTTVNTSLGNKPSGCIVWVWFREDESAGRMKLEYLFFGGGPRERLPDLGDRVGRHTKGDATGNKKERPNTRVLAKGRFSKIVDTEELMTRLFGPPKDV